MDVTTEARDSTNYKIRSTMFGQSCVRGDHGTDRAVMRSTVRMTPLTIPAQPRRLRLGTRRQRCFVRGTDFARCGS